MRLVRLLLCGAMLASTSYSFAVPKPDDTSTIGTSSCWSLYNPCTGQDPDWDCYACQLSDNSYGTFQRPQPGGGTGYDASQASVEQATQWCGYKTRGICSSTTHECIGTVPLYLPNSSDRWPCDIFAWLATAEPIGP